MTLALTTLRCPAGLPSQRREFALGTVSIGRGVECAWVLGDPERVLSKRHCSLAWQEDGWVIIDVSRNGTFLNNHPLDPGIPHPLRSGDRLSLGTYEIEVEITDQAEADDATGIGPLIRIPAPDRLTGDPFAPVDEPIETLAASLDSLARHDPSGPDSFWSDPAQAPPSFAASGSSQASDLRDAFRMPRPSTELLPSDWDSHGERGAPDASPGPSGPSTRASPTPAWGAAPEATPASGGADHGFGAFASGAGIAGTPPADPQQALHQLGAAFRAAIAGLRRVMIARAAIKSELRADQTIIRASGNNPLKFATDDDDALAALLGIGRRGGMTAEHAVAEVIRDLRLHELAMAAAVPEAIRSVLDALTPERLLRELPASAGDAIPGRRRQRAWTAFESLHARMRQDMDDNFHNLVGRVFTQAYEAALADLGRRGGDDDEPSAP